MLRVQHLRRRRSIARRGGGQPTHAQRTSPRSATCPSSPTGSSRPTYDRPAQNRVVAGCEPRPRARWPLRRGQNVAPIWTPSQRTRVALIALCRHFRSGRQDLNLRPPGPQPERSRRIRWDSALYSGMSCCELGSVALNLHPRLHPVGDSDDAVGRGRGAGTPAGTLYRPGAGG